MTREPSLATLKALAEAVAANVRGPGPWDAVSKALHAYEAEIAPRLRTRAEVDAEIARTVRTIGSRGGPHTPTELHPTTADLQHLVALRDELTAPEAETLVDCDVCDGKGETHDCSCAYPHRCYRCGGRGKLLRP